MDRRSICIYLVRAFQAVTSYVTRGPVALHAIARLDADPEQLRYSARRLRSPNSLNTIHLAKRCALLVSHRTAMPCLGNAIHRST